MALIGQYRKKIKSAKNIAKITKAMQLVAASKMKRAQVMASSGKEYAGGIIDLSNLLSKHLNKEIHPLIGDAKDPNAKTLVVLIAPEKGLCGGLVTNLSRYLTLVISQEGKNCEFIVVGNKAKQAARRMGLEPIAEFELGLSYPKYEIVPPIANLVEDKFMSGDVKKVVVVFAEFINTMLQTPQSKTLLPLQLTSQNVDSVETNIENKKDYIFEPSAKEIVNPLLEMYLEVEIYQLLLEAYASEQSARMVAMKNATDNATGLIDELTVEFNKVRQAAITNEILDIGNANMILS
jgi:F-type H+-transporting ATPase subunit gamma